MSDRQTPGGFGDPDHPEQSNFEREGDAADRARAPVSNAGEGVDREQSEAAGRLDAEFGSTGGGVDGGGGVLRGDQPVRHVGRRPATTSTADSRPVRMDLSESDGQGAGSYGEGDDFDVLPPREEDVDPRAARKAELQVLAWFLISAAATVAFIVIYVFGKIHGPDYGQAQNIGLGATLGLSLFGIGAAIIVWAKKLMPHESAVQDRHDFNSPPDEQAATEKAFFDGLDQSGFTRRPLLRNAMFLAFGVFVLPAVVLLRDLGPAPKTKLRRTAWKKGVRLVNVNTRQPVKLGDLREGGYLTVMPEGFEKLSEEDVATSASMLIRLRPGEDRPVRGRSNWSVDGHVVYSAICTHAGCPVKLYEQQTHHLLCPCHQSTFDVVQGSKVIFGPAARSLPQLAIGLDSEQYFIAKSGYKEPVGPSFWERG